MKHKASLAIFLLTALFVARDLHAHGVTAAKRIDRAVIVDIRYDDGEPFSYAEVKIYAPGGKTEYMNSRTDAGGVIAFVPNVKGTWRLVATDGMSHGKELAIDISDDSLAGDQGKNWSDARRQKVVTAILLVWAVVATSLYIGARKKTASL